MASNKSDPPGGDHILLLPSSSSQASTPSLANPPAAFPDTTTTTPMSGSHHPSSSTPSLALSHQMNPLPKANEQHPTHAQDSGIASDISHLSVANTPPPQNNSFLQKYIRTPVHHAKAYLSLNSATQERSQVHPRLPPWLLPQYRGRKPVLRSTLLRPLGRLLLLSAILAFLILSTILFAYREGQPEFSDYSTVTNFDWEPIRPRDYLSPMNASFGNQYDVLLDGHSHSTYSDGRMSPETLLKWHIANGYNAVIVSDHNGVHGGLAAQKIALKKYADKITVIPAMELTCCRIHMNLIGINETIDYAITKWPTDEQLKATIDRTHELGGLAIVNHIPWSNTTEYGYQLPRMQHHPSRERLVELGVDGFEVANGATLDTISIKFIQENNLLLMTGADVHYPDTTAYSWTILNTNGNRTAENIMAQLRARRTSFLFDPVGTQKMAYPSDNHEYYKTAAPTLLGQYFQMFWSDQTGMYSFSPEGGFCHEETVTIRWGMIGYFIAWVLVGFLMFEAARLLVVGCCWGPCQRRKRYLKKRKQILEQDGREARETESDPEDHHQA